MSVYGSPNWTPLAIDNGLDPRPRGDQLHPTHRADSVPVSMLGLRELHARGGQAAALMAEYRRAFNARTLNAMQGTHRADFNLTRELW